ncbi:hypothetical protein GCM10009799_13220 [Nocardiopsis rhodophaea]|uniref:Uncharacterized protein n=1 Tax=Nocardiopsis rhodophaea TaxID=280238 RepID=A0ABN2SLM4_9ACTN
MGVADRSSTPHRSPNTTPADVCERNKVGRIPDGGWSVHGRGSEQAKGMGRAKPAGAKCGYV